MRVGICDDEVDFHETLKAFIDKYAIAKAIPVIYYDFTSGEDLIKHLLDYNDIDVIFMDYCCSPRKIRKTQKCGITRN